MNEVETLRDFVPTQYAGGARDSVGATMSQKPQEAQKPATQGALAVRDIVDGARLWYVWGTLGWHDIRQRYRRSKIGPFWLTISMGVMIGALGGLYAGLFKADVAKYLPYVAVGFVVWGFISGLINDGCNAFIEGQGSIKQVRLPLSVYVYRVVWRNMIIFGHNLLIVVVVALVFAIRPGWTALLAVPAIVILCLNGVWAGLLLGLLSARFRDVPQIVTNAVQVVFFLTPIIWQPELLPGRALVVTFNPFFHAVEIVRAPLLGAPPPLLSWLAMLAATFVGAAVALAMYVRYRRRIAYWI
jgi:ABC-2 type transport system permease protein/lipopolysaccharide transport system permease protein